METPEETPPPATALEGPQTPELPESLRLAALPGRTRDDLLASSMFGGESVGMSRAIDETFRPDDDMVDLTKAIAEQVKLDASGAEELREQAAQREAMLVSEYFARRIASGSSPVQVLQGVAKAVGYSIGALISNSDHPRLILEFVDILENNRRAIVNKKAKLPAGKSVPMSLTWDKP